jgi:hypothetical protein
MQTHMTAGGAGPDVGVGLVSERTASPWSEIMSVLFIIVAG